ncbi:MAG: PAS domain S-box protein [Alphaproteobacteria bacterium]|jgi:PAS domain-containing protein|nr:PAS domain S-box protein [Alphaproteobacteria bacterium]MDP6588896.1 PAS domain S-box protein [Alphaproteobacteria bacterium]MDP6817469.1 PAS domain S-box protein [Alphaproteobacteria bacterium]|tara:strand:- start:38 stop:394 length:357 start_codon:yes stop_codon:yes gene_type:complete
MAGERSKARGARCAGRGETSSAREGRLSAIVDHVLDAIITIDERPVVASFTPAAERVFGYKTTEVIGKKGQDADAGSVSRRARWLRRPVSRDRGTPRSSASGVGVAVCRRWLGLTCRE